MSIQVNVLEAKTQLSRLLDRAEDLFVKLDGTPYEHASQGFQHSIGTCKATRTNIASCKPALFGVDNMHTALRQDLEVVLHGWVFPHLGMHRRANHHGSASC